jgi:preprotein translocase subunit SecF
MEFFKKTPSIRFMANRRWCYLVSAVLIIGSAVLLATRGLNLGIEFSGGVDIEVSYPGPANVEEVRAAVARAGHPEALVTQFGSDRELLIRALPREGEDINNLRDQIVKELRAKDPNVSAGASSVVYPQVGKELTEQGGLALLFTFLLILVYVSFRFEKKMAAGTVLAAMHDPIVIFGFFSLTQMTFDLPALAAVLAVIGYSINDTVVVFDRVREVFHGMRKATPTEVIDSAVNQTLSRTMMTSFSTLFVVVSLYLFGGEALKSFSIAIIVGVFVGTFSSIFVAGALAHDMKLNIRDLLPVQKNDPELDALP